MNALCKPSLGAPGHVTKILQIENGQKVEEFNPINLGNYQLMWSRGHKARGQGHKKNPRPRPRTAFPRTDTLEAKDRNARGQGQGPRTQAQVFSKKKKKKGPHKNFSSDLDKKTFSKKFFKRSTKV